MFEVGTFIKVMDHCEVESCVIEHPTSMFANVGYLQQLHRPGTGLQSTTV